ncbi:hypothetical protein MKX01_019909 [Papaver californicum]|nr:hypothetical protein MKX01_019909 [Papaver californicum]
MAIAERRSSGFSIAGFYLIALFICLCVCSEIQSVAGISCGVGKTYVVTNTTDYTGQCKYCPKEIETKCKLQGRPASTIEYQPFPATTTPPYKCGRCRDGCKSRCDFLVTAVAREMCSFMRYDGEEIYVCNCCCRDIQ